MHRYKNLYKVVVAIALLASGSYPFLVEANNSLTKAIKDGRVDYVAKKLQSGLKVEHRIKGETLLMIAAREGQLELVRLLVEKGANVNARSDKGHNAMSFSSRYGHLEVVKYLLNHGAEVNIMNNNKWTPLLKAARGGHLDVVDYLLAHDADIKSRNSAGLDALTLARRYRHKKLERYLKNYIRKYK